MARAERAIAMAIKRVLMTKRAMACYDDNNDHANDDDNRDNNDHHNDIGNEDNNDNDDADSKDKGNDNNDNE
jgi:hypothetical protein